MSKVTYVLGGIIVVLSLAAVCYFVTVLDSDLERKLEKVALQAEQAGSQPVVEGEEGTLSVPNPDIRPILDRAEVWGELIIIKPPPPKPPKPPNLMAMIQSLKVESTVLDGEGKVASAVILDAKTKSRALYRVGSTIRKQGLVIEKFTNKGVVLRLGKTKHIITLGY